MSTAESTENRFDGQVAAAFPEASTIDFDPPAPKTRGNIVSALGTTLPYDGPERRSSHRVPRSLKISVQPMDDQLLEMGKPFFAITRDISQGGLSFISSRRADFTRAIISLVDGIAPGVVCRICRSELLHSSGSEEFCLTNVEFLHAFEPGSIE